MAANFVEEIDLNFEEDLGSNGLYSSDVTHLRLKSFHPVGKRKILLANGKSVPVFPALEELQIKTMMGTKLNTHQVLGLFAYARKCKRLRKLSFIDCDLPLLFPANSLSKRLLEIEVSWNPLPRGFRLDSTTGKWILKSNEATTLESQDGNSLRSPIPIAVDIFKYDSKQLQKSKILRLKNASDHNIPISHLMLISCSPIANKSGRKLFLQSGLSLSVLSSLQKLEIGDYDRKLTNEEWAAILSYSSRCTSLKELKFVLYDPPANISEESIPSSLKDRNVRVWNFGFYRRLILSTGKFQACDKEGNLPGEEGFDKESYLSYLKWISEYDEQSFNNFKTVMSIRKPCLLKSSMRNWILFIWFSKHENNMDGSNYSDNFLEELESLLTEYLGQ